MLLTDLPVEIHSAIVAKLDIFDSYPHSNRFEEKNIVTDLRNVRLTCKALNAVATRQLFRSARLLPRVDSIAKWDTVLANVSLNPLVREAVIDTFPLRNWTSEYSGSEDLSNFEPPEEWKGALRRLVKFPNLEAVFLRFTSDCASEDSDSLYLPPVAETEEQRRDILQALFQAMAEVNAVQGRKIRVLSIKNLQNIVVDEIVESPDFKSVLAGLEELHVAVCTQYDESAPENSIMKEAVWCFWPRFTDMWLRPLASQLTSLTIYCDSYFGVLPCWNMRDLHFLKLKSLALGNYTFAYDWQVDWITKHNTLTSLSLDDCPIAHYYEVYGTEFEELERDEFTRLELGESGSDRFEGKLNWALVFTRLRTALSQLADFRIAHGAWDERGAFEHRETNGVYLPLRRYAAFNSGIGPSQWLELGNEMGEDDVMIQGYNDAFEDEVAVPVNDAKVREVEEEAYEALMAMVRRNVSR